MAETKFITLEGLARFKELLDTSYSAQFASKEEATGQVATDEQVDNLVDDIFSSNSGGTSSVDTDVEFNNMLDNIFG